MISSIAIAAVVTTRGTLTPSRWPQLEQTRHDALLHAQQQGLVAAWLLDEIATAGVRQSIAVQWRRSTEGQRHRP